MPFSDLMFASSSESIVLCRQSDRQQGCGNEWALNMDDRDLGQFLPAKKDQFDFGVCIPLYHFILSVYSR